MRAIALRYTRQLIYLRDRGEPRGWYKSMGGHCENAIERTSNEKGFKGKGDDVAWPEQEARNRRTIREGKFLNDNLDCARASGVPSGSPRRLDTFSTSCRERSVAPMLPQIWNYCALSAPA